MNELVRSPALEQAALVRLILPHDTEWEAAESREEMCRLAETAGAEIAAEFVQRRPAPCPKTLIGPGKVAEIRKACDNADIEVVIIDSDLTPKQGSNLEKALDRKVLDRTQLILDIFAQRAQTNEGKSQVELAQLQYILPRLAGRGSIMRQQGGIGVRGPGEQKLEVDRRVIRSRIQKLEQGLDHVRRSRLVQRKNRVETTQGTVALVGYTNAGKSSLLNALCGSEVLVADKLFATLDPRSRRCTLPSQRDVILTDTVGFIRKLPHTLVAAFRATLEEVNEADLLMLVADASHPAVEDHLRAVYEVLDEIGAGEQLTLIVFNKTDAADPELLNQILLRHPHSISVSAHTGENLDVLLAKIDGLMASRRNRVKLRIPQSEGRLVSQIHLSGRVFSLAYDGNDILLDAEIDITLENRLAEFVG